MDKDDFTFECTETVLNIGMSSFYFSEEFFILILFYAMALYG